MLYHLARVTFAALPLVGGAYLTYVALDDLARSREAAAWPTVQGHVVKNQPVGGLWYGGTLFEYAYQVNEVRHVSNRYSFGPVVLDAGAALSQGASVTVHYDPSDHAEAVVQTGVNAGQLLQAAVGLALVILAPAIWKQTA